MDFFLMFLKEASYAHQGCIYLTKKYSETVILCNIITNENNCFLFQFNLKWRLMYSCNVKADYFLATINSVFRNL